MKRAQLLRSAVATFLLAAGLSIGTGTRSAAAEDLPALMPEQSAYEGLQSDPDVYNASGQYNDRIEHDNGATYPGSQAYRDSYCGICTGSSRYPYDRCGCTLNQFPWFGGRGRMDSWCIGPKWHVAADGMILFRDNADWASVIADVGSVPSVVEQFDSGPGARLFVTGYNQSGFGLQVGYEGINSWNAECIFPLAGAVRAFDYESTFNSLEINFMPRTSQPWRLFTGIRYVELSEDFCDSTTNDKPLPAPADPPAAPVVVVDTGSDFLVKNQLIGLQLGARRDVWQWNKWLTFESFANAGVYHNRFKRTDVAKTITTVINGDDLATPDDNEFSQVVTGVSTSTRHDSSEIAFLGELGITAVVRINPCVALRAGYQAMVLDGVGNGLDAYFAGGLDSTTQFYHGLQFGAEYRR